MKSDISGAIIGAIAVIVAAVLGNKYLEQQKASTQTAAQLAMQGLTPDQAAAVSTAKGNLIGNQAVLIQNAAQTAADAATPSQGLATTVNQWGESGGGTYTDMAGNPISQAQAANLGVIDNPTIPTVPSSSGDSGNSSGWSPTLHERMGVP